MAIGNQIGHEHGSSPTDRRSHRTSKSRDRSISVYLLWKQPQNMEITTSNIGIFLQYKTTCNTERSSVLPPNWIQSVGQSPCVPKDKCTGNARAIIATARSKKRSKCHTRTGKTENDGTNHTRIHAIQSGRKGVARI